MAYPAGMNLHVDPRPDRVDVYDRDVPSAERVAGSFEETLDHVVTAAGTSPVVVEMVVPGYARRFADALEERGVEVQRWDPRSARG